MNYAYSTAAQGQTAGFGRALPTIVAWLTAFCVVFSLYAHTFVGEDTENVTPVLAFLIAGGLASMSMIWVMSPYFRMPTSPLRGIAAFCLFACWVGFAAFGIIGFLDRPPGVNDWGIFLLETGMPLLLLINNQRTTLLQATGFLCAAFAVLDAVANIGSAAGLWELADAGGRYTDFGERIDRFGGLTGNSLASGLVALIATGYIAPRLCNPTKWAGFAVAAILLALIGSSLLLTDARRYIAGAVMVVGMLAIPWSRFVPLPLVSAVLAGGGVYLTFNATDGENMQRADLMADGWREAASHILSGDGVYYRAAPVSSRFNDLWAAYATESGALDLAIAYGWVSTIMFILAALFAVGARRHRLTWPSVLLAVITGETAYTSPIDGFLGSVLFYGCLIYIISDEPPSWTRAVRRNVIDRTISPDPRAPVRQVATVTPPS